MPKLTNKKGETVLIGPMEEICEFLHMDVEDFRDESPIFYNDMLEEKGLEYKIEETPWYAVISDKESTDWGSGSYDLKEAKEYAKTIDAYSIAVINEGFFSNDDTLCIDEIYDFD